MSRTLRSLTDGRGLLFGGDYNPEQWDRTTWDQDVADMQAAGVNLVTVGVFSWALLEPSPGRFEPDWLDDLLDLLAGAGIAVDLATPTASPPPWLSHGWPQTLPVDRDGRRLGHGARTHFCPTSPEYRERARWITGRLAERYAGHDAVVMWHVGNELGHTCWCASCAAAFRTWLRARYDDDLDALNRAWGTAVWGQVYGAWEEIRLPGPAPYLHHPALTLEHRRFASDMLLEVFVAQRDAIRAHDAVRPVTTNMMGLYPGADYASWGGEIDVVSDDSYPDPADAGSPARAALTHDLMRSIAGGPWLLLEQAVGAVSWRPHNVGKTRGRMRQDAFRALAHGSDGVLSFQWRASPAGPERFHSAMVPHAGTETRSHRAVRELGADLAKLGGLCGSPVRAQVALLFDWSSWWALQEPGSPGERVRAVDQLLAWYRPLWRAGVAVDVVRPGADLAPYALVLAPQLYLLDDDDATHLRRYLAGGGSLALGPFSAVADGLGRVRTGRFPVPFADLLGASGEEWMPLAEPVRLVSDDLGEGTASTWAEPLDVREGPGGPHDPSATVLARFAGGDLDGAAALVRSPDGRVHHLATLPDEQFLDRWLRALLRERGVEAPGVHAEVPDGVEAAVRGDHTFLLNHAAVAVTVRLRRPALDVLAGTEHTDDVLLEPSGTAILTERRR